MTYGEARRKVQHCLETASVPDAQTDAWLLMEYVCRIDRSFYFLHEKDEMDVKQLKQYEELALQRSHRIPLQYLTGEQEFMGLNFSVTPDVLIPRQDTEVLVEETLKYLKPGMKVLDLCTGSGCIAVSLKYMVPESLVWAADISEKALAVARNNAERIGVQISFIESDVMDHIEEMFDIIVSNPPYIRSDVIPTLMPEVKCHEPMRALDGSDDGLLFYNKITEAAIGHLNPGGMLLYEIGNDQAREVSDIMKRNGFIEIYTIKDLAGLDRVTVGRRL